MSTSASSVPAPSPPATAPPPSGDLHDAGAVRRESVRAERWSAQGAAKVLGNVEVDSAELSGLVSIRGSLIAGTVTARGTLDVGGVVRVSRSIGGDGTLTFGSSLDGPAIDLRGSASVAGAIRSAGTVRWKGALDATEITAVRVEYDGRASIRGAVVATEVVGRLRGESTIGAIRADRVTITRPGRLFGGGRLEVLTIEAKEVELEGIHCQHVRAERILLGPGCQIAQVEGTIVRRHPSAHVGPASQSPPPYGLFR
jgi:cytoskeletal protein CcmA (bactofilin family)